MQKRDHRYLKLFIVGAWLVFSLSLATWWIVFGLNQLDRINALDIKQGSEIARHQKMLMWEGGVLLFLLLSGGSALGYFVYQETKRFRQINEFFATFSHELKTSIASLRLQAESLQEDFENPNQSFDEHHRKLLNRLLKDSVRLELQLENSLFLANISEQKLFVERLSLARIVESLKPQWPSLKIEIKNDQIVRGDRRAIESIFKNLIQNAAIHGRASQILVTPKLDGEGVRLDFEDDGVGFSGDKKDLGKLFSRHNPTSGSGVGLYLSQQLMKKMGGELQFRVADKGFATRLRFQGMDL
jgi:signal transduction histidine kinase